MATRHEINTDFKIDPNTNKRMNDEWMKIWRGFYSKFSEDYTNKLVDFFQKYANQIDETMISTIFHCVVV